MHAGRLAGGDDRVARRVVLEARDILPDRAGEQLDILRQVADVLAELGRHPLIERGAVEADLAARGRPHADDHARKRRFAGRARADYAEPSPAFRAKFTS